jgi:hypothetical protein
MNSGRSTPSAIAATSPRSAASCYSVFRPCSGPTPAADRAATFKPCLRELADCLELTLTLVELFLTLPSLLPAKRSVHFATA